MVRNEKDWSKNRFYDRKRSKKQKNYDHGTWTTVVFVFVILAVQSIYVFGNQEDTYASVSHLLVGENSVNITLLGDDLFSDEFHNYSPRFTEDGLAFISGDFSIQVSSSKVSGRGGSMSFIHEVRANDTIESLAKEFNVTKETIVWENDISDPNSLKVGQELHILPFSGVRHRVRSGETLSEIAEYYDISVKEIAKFNHFSVNDVLIAGNPINIPGAQKRQKNIVTQTTRSTTSSVSIQAVSQPSPSQAISSGFIPPLKPGTYIITQRLHGYNAVDMAPVNGIGSRIYAAASGTVTQSATGWNGGYGNMIVISHPNGTRTLYSHNQYNYVSVGQYVSQGDVIGTVGSTGLSTGPHVHFEVHGARNPFAY